MTRHELIQQARALRNPWDLIVIGGGATGLGAGVDAASRGYRTLLLDQGDFASGTSSRSTKLIHGGVRYLRQGNVGLVAGALRERGLLTQNAPHLVSHLALILPHYSWWEAPFYGAGLKLYDVLAGRLGLGRSQRLSRAETLQRLPTLEAKGLKGGIIYYDGQFDDARLAVTLARTFSDLGGVPLNYMRVQRILKRNGLCCGVVGVDSLDGGEYEFKARGVINATGVFVDAVRRLDEPQARDVISPSQGAHIVLDRSFLPGEFAILVPKTDDGRVLFAIPWQGRVLVGTTDTPVRGISSEPRPLEHEIDYLLTHTARYLTQDPARRDVLSTFAGLRPLMRGSGLKKPAALSRDHQVMTSNSGLITITGGKWTTYRKMGQDVVDDAAVIAGLEERASNTASLKLHGWQDGPRPGPWAAYGSDGPALEALARTLPQGSTPLHPKLPITPAHVVWAARHEMAVRLEDVLSRRTRCLLLDARASVDAAPAVAKILAQELGRDRQWEESEVKAFAVLAAGYM